MQHIVRFLFAATVALQVLALPASAQPKDFSAYARMAGEIGIARSNCGFDLDYEALRTIGRSFVATAGDAAAQDKAENLIAAELARASQQYHKEGAASFCRAMLAAYGPSGRLAPGILKTR